MRMWVECLVGRIGGPPSAGAARVSGRGLNTRSDEREDAQTEIS